jgi:hypothetical protein
MKPHHHRLLSGSLVLALLFASGASHADKPRHRDTQPSLAQSLKGEAKEAYSSAELLMNNGDFSGAVSKYQQAYDLSKDARLLFDMAVAEKSLHAYARMEKHLEQYLREAGSTATAEDKAAVDTALGAIKNLVGSVTLDVAPAGATVSIDGQAAGKAPLDGPLMLDLGTHTLLVEADDFEPSTQTFEVQGGATRSLHISLVERAHGGHLIVTSDAEANVVIDGQTIAKGRFDGALSTGAHDVRVTAPGRLPYQASVELHDGETRTLDVTLRAEPHVGAPLWPWIAGGAVVVAGAAVGGYFLFKPHDTTTPVPDGTFGPPVRLSAFK